MRANKWMIAAMGIVKVNFIAIAVVLVLGLSPVILGGCKGKKSSSANSSGKRK